MQSSTLKIDPKTIVSYFEKLVRIPSPTGFTRYVQDFLVEQARSKNIQVTTTRKGAVRFSFEGENEAGKVLAFAAHVDTLGAMVRSVTGEKIKIAPVGSLPAFNVIGDHCTIHAFDSTKYSGTILPDNPSTHVSKKWEEERIKFDDLHVRIDKRIREKEKLDKLIPIGSYVTLDPGFRFDNEYINSRFLDDKASAAVLLALSDQLLDPKSGLLKEVQEIYILFNITEETGQGLAGLPENLDALIIVDMGVVGDGVAGDEYSVSICVKDSSGPYHYELTQQLIEIAEKNKIPYKTDVFPFYGSDGSAALRAGKDVKVALIGPGVAASHGYERTHIDALDATFRLVSSFIQAQ